MMNNVCPLVGQNEVWEKLLELLNTPCHIFLTGAAGSGKSTLVKKYLKLYAQGKSRPNIHDWGETTHDECLLLGAEQDRGIQTIRGHVSLFIRQKTLEIWTENEMKQLHRWVIIDDADTFPQISQQALRRPMETYSHVTRFIFVGTSEEDLIPALRSRCVHISMNAMNPFLYRNDIIQFLQIPYNEHITVDMWLWLVNISNSNTSELFRLLHLLKNIIIYKNKPPTLKLVELICSAPAYNEFYPLLTAIVEKNTLLATEKLLAVWKKGYTFEDILDSLQVIHHLFSNNVLAENVQLHVFLVNSWISYCKGNTSILALTNVLYNSLTNNTFKESPYDPEKYKIQQV
jgi:hypothetical protein